MSPTALVGLIYQVIVSHM